MPLFTLNAHKSFTDLSEREILALAIGLEEEDGRIYRDYAEGLRADYPASARGVRAHGRGGERRTGSGWSSSTARSSASTSR